MEIFGRSIRCNLYWAENLDKIVTYCLGIITCYGLVMAADSRTNAGVDHVSTYRKLFDFSQSPKAQAKLSSDSTTTSDRVLILCTSGNLSITQATIMALQEDLKDPERENLHNISTIAEAARYIGQTLRVIQGHEREWLEKDGIDYHCNILLGGQIGENPTALYMIYSQGNFIRAMPETPFLQIGEIKYGRPILDRTLTFQTKIEDAAKCALLSIDSTMKSNISVGPPIDLVMYHNNSLRIRHQIKLRRGDPYLLKVRQQWENSLQEAFDRVPPVVWTPDFAEPADLDDFSGFLN
jgi:putative proteasome-type protease